MLGRKRLLIAAVAAAVAFASGVPGWPPAPPADAAGVDDPVLVGAGDIASCDSTGDEATAALLDGIPGTVFTTGDAVYGSGTATDFDNCYNPSWGRHKARTRPAIGNHEYAIAGAAGYYGYFGAAAGDPAKGYYSYDLGAWHIVVVNSTCSAVGGCGAGSPQELWLRADLAATPAECIAAVWHHPVFSSSVHGPTAEMKPIYQALYDFGADVVLNGHDHVYERFAPQDAAGVADPDGPRQFIVGTGGRSHYGISTVRPNSEVRNNDTYGVLKLTLHADSYDWQFVPEAGKTFADAGTGDCHTGLNTVIDSGPIGTVASTAATFGFSSPEPGATFQCRLDGAAFAACTSPRSYTDLADGDHTFQVLAIAPDGTVDASPASRTWTVDTTVKLPFAPVADATVMKKQPTKNFGTTTSLTADAAPRPVEAYARFTVTGITNPVRWAKLRLYATNGSTDGPALYPTVTTAWRETSITWNNRPARSGAALDDLGAVSSGTFVDYDITSLVRTRGNGSYGFELATVSGDDTVFTSKQGTAANRPQLIVALEGTATGDSTAPQTTIVSGPAGTVSSTTATFTFSSNEAGSTFRCVVDGGTPVTNTSPITYTGLSAGPHTFEVAAVDPVGNIDPTPATWSWTVDTSGAPPATVTFNPEADVKVLSDTPTTNYGASTTLRADGAPDAESYLRFNVGGLSGSVQRAVLRLYVVGGTSDGPAVYRGPTSWDEATMTWNSRPGPTGSAVADPGTLPADSWVEYDVTGLITGNGLYGLTLMPTSDDGVNFGSREGANRPQLVVTTG